MKLKSKYNIMDKVRVKIHYQNDSRTEVEAIIRGIDLNGDTDEVKYKIWFEPEEFHKKQGCIGCICYVKQDDILELIK